MFKIFDFKCARFRLLCDIRSILIGILQPVGENEMNWEAIGAAGEVIGALAVIATLFYLAKQIKHSSESQDRANEIAQTSSITSSNALFLTGWEHLAENEELAAIYDRALSGQELDSIESVRFTAFLNMYFAWMEVLYSQASANLAFNQMGKQEVVEIGRPYYSKLLSSRVGSEWWKGEAKAHYSPDFYDDISVAVSS